ncbi:MAG: plastocyanin [Hyphomicrobiaceae bacterium]|jgi:plastocyanin
MIRIAIASCLLFVLSACGGGSDSASSGAAKPTAAAAAKALSGKAIVKGVIRADANAARGRRVKMQADPFCAGLHEGPPVDRTVRVVDGMLEGAVVYVKDGPIGSGHAPSAEKAVLDQNGCLYEPRVVALQVRQILEVRNSDQTLHNVHAVAKKAGSFNAAMPMKGQKISKRFSAPEVFVRIKCDVHPWMEAHAAVFDHPFFAVTAADGSFSIEGLPAGSYTFGIAHPFVGRSEVTLKVTEEAPAEIDVTLGHE